MFSFVFFKKKSSVNYEFRQKLKLFAIILVQEGRGCVSGIILISCNPCQRIIILGFVV